MMYADDTTLYLNLEDFDCQNLDNKIHEFSYQSKNDPTYCAINRPQTYSTSVNFQFPEYHVRL